MSVGVLPVSRLPGIIWCGLCLDITPMDNAMKQALIGVIAGYVAKKSKKKQKSLVDGGQRKTDRNDQKLYFLIKQNE